MQIISIFFQYPEKAYELQQTFPSPGANYVSVK